MSTTNSGTSPHQEENNVITNNNKPALTIGVFGGSFNPIHLGHALLAITTQQTMPVDEVVLVPVYKHAVKTDLLPFADRVHMCRLAVAPFSTNSRNTDENSSSSGSGGGIRVSAIEQDVGESNGAMLKALKQQYPPSTKFMWICGDDFFRWWQRPKGLETLSHVHGLIVQRRLHKASTDSFFKEPMDEDKIRAQATQLNLTVNFIYGELPHFSSTLVRRAPGTWKSFLPQSVSHYLDERPHLLQQLHDNLEADAKKEEESEAAAAAVVTTTTGKKRPRENENNNQQQNDEGTESSSFQQQQQSQPNDYSSSSSSSSYGAACVMRGLGLVHALQIERGRTGLRLSMGTPEMQQQLNHAQANTDALIQEFLDIVSKNNNNTSCSTTTTDEVMALSEDLKQIPVWLQRDRYVSKCHGPQLVDVPGAEGWSRRLALVEKYNPRIDVLIGASIRALQEILDSSKTTATTTHGAASSFTDATTTRHVSDLLLKWSQGKEALGRLRAFVCAGGPSAPTIVRESYEMRQLLHQRIETKEHSIARVLSSLQTASSSATATIRMAAPDALHKLLEQVTMWEWSLLGCFASSTPLPLIHKLLSNSNEQNKAKTESFDVVSFFYASSAALDLMLTFVKALAASGLANA